MDSSQLILRHSANEVVVTATRKSKGKSRLGCKTCKLRRVKCDEGHPTCGRCITASRTCVYENTKIKDWQTRVRTFEVPKTLQPSTIPAFLSQTPTLFQNDSITNGTVHRKRSSSYLPRRIVETVKPSPSYSAQDVQLLCHFISHTSQNIVDEPEIWRNQVIQLAFQHDFLMHGILTLSATHLQHLKPSDNSYKFLSSYHLSHTLASYSAALRQEGPQNCDAFMATAFLLLAQSSATPTFDPTKTNEDTFLSLSAGIRTVAAKGMRDFENSIFRNMVTGPLVLPPKRPVDGPGLDLVMMIQQASATSDTSSCEVAVLTQVVESLNPLLEITTRTISALSSLPVSLKVSRTYTGFFQRFVSFLPPLFVDMVHKYDARALIIISYYYGCTGYFSGLAAEPGWWWKGRPSYMVTNIAKYVGEKWAYVMEWPLEMVKTQPRLERNEEFVLGPGPPATNWSSERKISHNPSSPSQQQPGFT